MYCMCVLIFMYLFIFSLTVLIFSGIFNYSYSNVPSVPFYVKHYIVSRVLHIALITSTCTLTSKWNYAFIQIRTCIKRCTLWNIHVEQTSNALAFLFYWIKRKSSMIFSWNSYLATSNISPAQLSSFAVNISRVSLFLNFYHCHFFKHRKTSILKKHISQYSAQIRRYEKGYRVIWPHNIKPMRMHTEMPKMAKYIIICMIYFMLLQ